MNAAAKKIMNIISWLLVIFVAILAILLAGIRLIGITPYTVLSGSMEPQYKVGSLVYVKKAAPEKIKEGDVITFILNEDLVVVTHRVVEVDVNNRFFITKGDANNTQDGSPVHFENLVGKVIFSIPFLGYFSNWIVAPPGLYIGLAIGVTLLIMVLLPDLFDKACESDKKAKVIKKLSDNAQ